MSAFRNFFIAFKQRMKVNINQTKKMCIRIRVCVCSHALLTNTSRKCDDIVVIPSHSAAQFNTSCTAVEYLLLPLEVLSLLTI